MNAAVWYPYHSLIYCELVDRSFKGSNSWRVKNDTIYCVYTGF